LEEEELNLWDEPPRN